MKITAAVVAFHPDLPTLELVVTSILPQVQSLIVIDNSDTIDMGDGEAIKELLPESVVYLSLSGNRGVAAAHNYAVRYAQDEQADYLLLLDQDSVASPRMVLQLRNAHQSLTATGAKVAAVGPQYRDGKNGYESFFIQLGWFASQRPRPSGLPMDAIVQADMLISSGMLVSLPTLAEVGTMDEGLFIVHVDTEWFLRAASMGYRAYGVCGAEMVHALGDEMARIWLGRWRTVPIHRPFRLYYIFRNSLNLYRRSYTPLRWIVFDLKRLILMFVLFGFFMGQRRARLAMMVKGIRHGFLGRTGLLQGPTVTIASDPRMGKSDEGS